MLRDRLGKELLFFDGGMGTLLQEQGLKPGELPEIWNMERPEIIREIHRKYFEAGSNMVLANTFGANRCKFHSEEYTTEEIIERAVAIAKEAAKEASGEMSGKMDGKPRYVGLDIGPTGKLLEPLGDLSFEGAYEVFREMVISGEKAGADFIHIETMSDIYEVKAAVLAAKENTNLPVTVTVVFDSHGKMLTGGTVAAAAALLEGLRVDAIGMNCGLGPEQMIPLLEELRKYTSLPIIMKPNAGLPKQRGCETYYDVDPEKFAKWMEQIVDMGACVVGGCCGTTPEHIRQMVSACAGKALVPPEKCTRTLVSSYGQAVEIGKAPIIIGERINPTGKKRLKEALKNHELDYILKEGITQEERGAHILDVNVGLPDIDEKETMAEVIRELQGVTNLPLQIDTVDIPTMERAMRLYNGKPMINSVNGKKESMDAVFPLVQKYGGVVVALTLDENGIPGTAEGRIAVAEKIIKEAAKYGIEPKDIVVDVLAMTISSEPEGAKITLEALKGVRERFGVGTVLGVSNISFGLPNRPVINSNFYTMALHQGLSAGIINPSSDAMMQSYHSYMALMNYDTNCENYIAQYGNVVVENKVSSKTAGGAAEQNGVRVSVDEKNRNGAGMPLNTAIEKGLKQEAKEQTEVLLAENKAPLDIINEELIPALDKVGKGFEAGTVFLPQLLMSAEAAKNAFDVIKNCLKGTEDSDKPKNKIILATVKGDIHDIGKNIVKVLLENYGFIVIDLGKDVEPEAVVQAAVAEDVRLVGLSALMTTTVTSMEETIKKLREKKPECKIMVGGAVLNQDYADMIGADFYGKDAMQSVRYAKELFEM